MRRILVEDARRKRSLKHGGGHARVALDDVLLGDVQANPTLLEIDELLEQLASVNPKAAELVKLRFFAGLTGEQTAVVLDMSPRSVDLLWAYARAWLFEKIQRGR
jgi:RNA polymerase sigma factor (TIGR02999 family)